MKYLLIILLILSLLMLGKIYAQTRKLDDLVDITDGEIILKHSLTLIILGQPVTLEKGKKITIGE